MSASIPLSEADLHGLVDGHLDPSRRADVIRRLAGSPKDRAKIDAWQDQNDLIRHVFLGVEKESLPAPLKLTQPPSLHCVLPPEGASGDASAPRRKRPMAGFVTMALVAIGVGGTVMLIQSPDDGSQIIRLRGTVDEALATRAAGAVDMDALDTDGGVSTQVRSTTDALADALPTTTIPDLTPAGFSFTRAETLTSVPGSLVFHYRNAATDRIAVSVARAPSTADIGPTPVGRGFSWHRGDNAFAIAGTIRPARLRAIATLLQSGPGE